MKILFISTKFYPDVISGGQISSYHIAKSLTKNNDVYVLTLYKGKKIIKEKLEGLTIIRIPYKKRIKILSNLDLMWLFITKLSLKYIKKIKPDIIHLINFEPIFYNSFFIKFFFPKIKIVTTVNGPLFGCFTQSAIDYKGDTCTKCRVTKRMKCSKNQWGSFFGGLYYLYSIWYMNLLKFSYKYIDKFFVVSDAMKPLLTSMGVSNSKITKIYNPIQEPRKIKLSVSQIKKKYTIKQKKVILFAGRLAKEKGIHHVINAMKKIEDTIFLIVGNKRGDYNYFKEIVLKNKLDKKVRFLGFIKHDDLQELYKITDLVVLPETFYEPLSRLLLEAASYGIPTIATDIGGNSEIIQDGKTGILIKKQEFGKLNVIIKNILIDKNKRNLMSENAKLQIRNSFLDDNISKKYNKNYNNIYRKSNK
jgi:glycosyltransferase involved in cell wall biosynthesis